MSARTIAKLVKAKCPQCGRDIEKIVRTKSKVNKKMCDICICNNRRAAQKIMREKKKLEKQKLV